MRVLKFLICLMLATVTVAGAAFCFVGCDKDEDVGDETNGDDGVFDPYPYEDLSVFMDVPDYKNITLSEEHVSRLVNTELSFFCRSKGIDVEVFDAAREWDMAELSLTGFVDGEVDAELCATGYLITLGSDSFYVDGLEEAVIGMLPGDNKSVELKFADDYPSVKYAGKSVTYVVKLDRLYRTPELTDGLCMQYTAFESAEEYLLWLRKACVFQYVWDGLLSECVIKSYPNTEYTEYYQYFKSNFQTLAEQSGMSFADFIYARGDFYAEYGLFNGMSVVDFEAVATNYAKSNLVNDLLTYSIIRLEGIKTEGEEFENAARMLEKEFGLTYEEIVEKNGEKTAIISVLNVRLCEVIYGYVTVT